MSLVDAVQSRDGGDVQHCDDHDGQAVQREIAVPDAVLKMQKRKSSVYHSIRTKQHEPLDSSADDVISERVDPCACREIEIAVH